MRKFFPWIRDRSSAVAVPKVDIDELMERVREELGRRKDQRLSNSVSKPHIPEDQGHGFSYKPIAKPSLERLAECQEVLDCAQASRVSLDDLLLLSGGSFILSAYRCILGRDPDSEGLEHFMGRLSRGEMQKLDVIIALSFSSEGKKAARVVEGLTSERIIRKVSGIPILSTLVRSILDFFRMPSFRSTCLKALERQQRQEEERRRVINANMAALSELCSDLLENQWVLYSRVKELSEERARVAVKKPTRGLEE